MSAVKNKITIQNASEQDSDKIDEMQLKGIGIIEENVSGDAQSSSTIAPSDDPTKLEDSKDAADNDTPTSQEKM